MGGDTCCMCHRCRSHQPSGGIFDDIKAKVAAIGDAECATLIENHERCEQDIWDHSTTEQKAARTVLKADHNLGWISCAHDPLECGRSSATGWAENVLDPCRINDTSCLEPTQCWLGACGKTLFSGTPVCRWQNKVPRNV